MTVNCSDRPRPSSAGMRVNTSVRSDICRNANTTMRPLSLHQNPCHLSVNQPPNSIDYLHCEPHAKHGECKPCRHICHLEPVEQSKSATRLLSAFEPTIEAIVSSHGGCLTPPWQHIAHHVNREGCASAKAPAVTTQTGNRLVTVCAALPRDSSNGDTWALLDGRSPPAPAAPLALARAVESVGRRDAACAQI